MIERNKTTDILAVDFTQADDVIECASRILDRANELELFVPETSRQSRDAVQLIREATMWVNNVKSLIESSSTDEALSLIDVFDLIHRIAFQQPADRTFVNAIILKAFEARIHGDKTVDEYILYRVIYSRIIYKDKAYFGRPLTWLSLTLDRWHKEAVGGYDKTVLSTYDIINRASILLEANLFAYEGRTQKAFKQHLAATTRHYLDNYDATDLKARYAVEMFRNASDRHISL